MEGPLKILMTADTVGGVWTYTIDLCKALSAYNAEIHLLTMGAFLSKEQYRQVRKLSNVKLNESNYKLEWMQDCAYDLSMAKEWIKSVYNRVKPHIIHFNNYGQTAGQWDCPVVTVYHSCVHTWWKAVKKESPPADWDRYTHIVEDAISASNVIVAPTKGILHQAEEVFGKISASHIIYNGNDPVAAEVEGKEPIILSAGRIWDEAKNMILLSNIAHRLSWPVYIAGNNADPNCGKELSFQNVNFIGKLSSEEMQQWMHRSAVFVMPAKYEPFGLAVLEAAKAGCALALSNISTLREIWGDAALYFDPSDEDDAAAVIQRLTDDTELRNEMAAKASARANGFTAEKMADNYMNLYRQLLTHHTDHEPATNHALI